MTTTNPKLLKQYFATDAKLIPLRNWQDTKSTSKGVLKMGKMPLEKGWHEKDYDQERINQHMESGSNVGFKVGDGWGILDFDPRNDLDADGQIKERKKWTIWKVLDDFDIREGEYAYTETGGGGLHIYLRIPEGYHGRETLAETYGKGVEFKTSPRKYVVAAGSVHPGKANEGLTPRPYLWGANSRALTQTRHAPESLLEAFGHAKPKPDLRGTGDESFGRYSGEELAKVLSAFNPVDFGRNSTKNDSLFDWVGLMFACHWFTGGEGREEFIEWCLGDPEYSDDAYIIGHRWDSCNGRTDGVKSGRLFKLLEHYKADGDCYPREKTSEIFIPPHPDELEFEVNATSIEGQTIHEMNKEYAVVLLKSKAVIMRDDWDITTPDQTTVSFAAPKEMYVWFKNKKIVVPTKDGKVKEMTKYDYWLEHPERREYRGINFVPDEEREFMTPAGLFFNEWRGWPFRIEEGRGPGDWNLLQRHIFECICAGDQKIYDYLMKWMAYSVQRARGPQKVAFVIRGPKGIGKNLFVDAWLKCFGLHGIEIDDDNIFLGKYNRRMGTTMGLFLNEAVWAGDRTKVGKLKHRINGQTIVTEDKYLPLIEVKNNLKIMMATNEAWAVPAEDNERRFVVTDAIRAHPKNDPFYKDVAAQLYGKNAEHTHGIRAMFYDLIHMDITGFDPETNIIQTRALGDQVRQTYGDVGEWWYDTVTSDTLPYKFDPEPQFRQDNGPMSDWENRPVAVPMSVVRDHLLEYVNGKPQGDLGYNFKQKYVNAVMRMMPSDPEAYSRVRLTLPKREEFSSIQANSRGQCDCFIIPARPHCIEHLNKMFQIDGEEDGGADIDYGQMAIKADLDELA